MSFMEPQTVSTPNHCVPRHWQADEHAHWWQFFFCLFVCWFFVVFFFFLMNGYMNQWENRGTFSEAWKNVKTCQRWRPRALAGQVVSDQKMWSPIQQVTWDERASVSNHPQYYLHSSTLSWGLPVSNLTRSGNMTADRDFNTSCF